jgi:hypothetical protein
MTRGELRSAARRNDRDPQLIASFLARTLGDGSQGELRAGIDQPDFPCGSGAVAEL